MAEEAKTRIELRRPHTTGAAVHAGDIIDAYEIVGGPLAPTVTRYLHLPVQDSKRSRRDLQAHLPAALQFLSHHLCHGRQVLVHDTDGGWHCAHLQGVRVDGGEHCTAFYVARRSKMNLHEVASHA